MKEVSIKWEEPVSQKEIIDDKSGHYAKQQGFYIFYGYHYSYSKDENDNNVLLYIEKTDNLAKDIRENGFLFDGVPEIFKPDEIKISLGTIQSRSPHVHLACIEKLLVFAHCPSWNYDYIESSDRCYKDLIIRNDGYNKQLRKEVRGWNFYRR